METLQLKSKFFYALFLVFGRSLFKQKGRAVRYIFCKSLCKRMPLPSLTQLKLRIFEPWNLSRQQNKIQIITT